MRDVRAGAEGGPAFSRGQGPLGEVNSSFLRGQAEDLTPPEVRLAGWRVLSTGASENSDPTWGPPGAAPQGHCAQRRRWAGLAWPPRSELSLLGGGLREGEAHL